MDDFDDGGLGLLLLILFLSLVVLVISVGVLGFALGKLALHFFPSLLEVFL